jgi:hypothetical protein
MKDVKMSCAHIVTNELVTVIDIFFAGDLPYFDDVCDACQPKYRISFASSSVLTVADFGTS